LGDLHFYSFLGDKKLEARRIKEIFLTALLTWFCIVVIVIFGALRYRGGHSDGGSFAIVPAIALTHLSIVTVLFLKGRRRSKSDEDSCA
jgi:fatty acid desaturase